MTNNIDFTAPTAYPLFYRTYSRYKTDGTKESPQEAKDRSIKGLENFGLLTEEELELIRKYFYANQVFVSGRWFWVGGTEWVEKQKNYIGAYNCASVPVTNWDAFRFNFRALLMGCGVGTVVELDKIEQLPEIKYPIDIKVIGELGSKYEKGQNIYENSVFFLNVDSEDSFEINYVIGDSKEGWVDVMTNLLEFSSMSASEILEKYGHNKNKIEVRDYKSVTLKLDPKYVRPKGEVLEGFGGLSNPDLLIPGLQAIVDILNNAVGRQLDSLEVCLVTDWAGAVAVSGNIRRSAKLQQGSPNDNTFVTSKDNLWVQDSEGNWKIDPKRDVLRLSNHTLVYHDKPDLETIVEAVRKQYYSGEGAIQYAPEAIARCNIDILNTDEKKKKFLELYCCSKEQGTNYLKLLAEGHGLKLDERELEHRSQRYQANPCHSGDTLVPTNKGLIPIKDLVGEKFQALVDLRSVGLEGVRLTDAIAFSSGIQTTYTILLGNGLKMRATADHKHFTNQGWVSTKDLISDIKISIQRGEGSFGQGTITEKQAQMLGWLYGDGSIYKNKYGLDVVFYMNPKEYATVSPVLLEAVESVTGYQHKSSLVKGLYTFHSGSQYMRDFLGKLGVESKKCLPDSFLTQSKEVIVGFLQGLFSSDGHVCKHGSQIGLTNMYYDLLRQVQIILLNLGIKSSLAKKSEGKGLVGIKYTLKDGTEKISKNRGSWVLTVSKGDGMRNFYKSVGFPFAPDKQERLELAMSKPRRFYKEKIQEQWYTSKVVSVIEFGEEPVYDLTVPLTHSFIANGCITHNCFEVIGKNFLCNLSQVHLNNLDPNNVEQQKEAFKASTLSALPLLSHVFDVEEFRYSREIDPIIGISFTGLFDFFVHKFGKDWLDWLKTGRNREYKKAQHYLDSERECLELWRDSVKDTVEGYCKRHKIRQPNRYTVVQPSGSISLLTNASAGWHPPKATRYIRRITYSKDSPIVQACIDYGYNVIPSQSCKNENGKLLDDINDSRVNEVLVEIPIEVSWASIADEVDFNPKDIGVLAQLDLFMQVQKYYATHTTSSTLELSEYEIEPLGRELYRIIQNDEGYISSALLAKFESLETFPRLPFEPISHEKYLTELEGVKQRQISNDFLALVNQYSTGESSASEQGPAGCDSDKCLMPERK